MSNWPATGGLDPLPTDAASPIGPVARKAGEAPVGVAIEQNSCMVLLVAEFRASCQQTAMLPDRRLLAILGRNWLRFVASSLTRIGGLLQFAPLSSEKRTRTSVSLLSFTVS